MSNLAAVIAGSLQGALMDKTNIASIIMQYCEYNTVNLCDVKYTRFLAQTYDTSCIEDIIYMYEDDMYSRLIYKADSGYRNLYDFVLNATTRDMQQNPQNYMFVLNSEGYWRLYRVESRWSTHEAFFKAYSKEIAKYRMYSRLSTRSRGFQAIVEYCNNAVYPVNGNGLYADDEHMSIDDTFAEELLYAYQLDSWELAHL